MSSAGVIDPREAVWVEAFEEDKTKVEKLIARLSTILLERLEEAAPSRSK